jgi:SAM-dependent methyltransferase
MPVSRDEIRWAYRLLLAREPRESEVDAWTGVVSLAQLRARFVASAEFKRRLESDLRSPLPRPARMALTESPTEVEWRIDPAAERRLLQHVQQAWTALGVERPHWSVLSANEFLPERIAETQTAFYESGADAVDVITGCLARQGLGPDDLGRIVEYGCGVGRVTPHLARQFRAVTAIDISESHLAMAREAVASASCSNVSFRQAEIPHFGMNEPFDLWISGLVLQHNPPPVIALILQRAFTMLVPGGIALFQLPTYAQGYKFDLAAFIEDRLGNGGVEMHCLPQNVVFSLASVAGCVALEVREDDQVPTPGWLSNTFVFRKG